MLLMLYTAICACVTDAVCEYLLNFNACCAQCAQCAVYHGNYANTGRAVSLCIESLIATY